MNELLITAYRGFTRVAGETTLSAVMANIIGGTYFPTVQKVEQQLRLGDIAKANAIKKQLPFFTLTGNYREVRQPHSLTRYNPVLTIDVDDLPAEAIDPARQALAQDPDVLACFLTPKRRGFKIFLYLRTPAACLLRKTTFAPPTLTYAELEQHHALMYEAARLHVEQRLGVPVDVSGKDIGRGFFASFDPQAYLNTALLHEVELPATRILCPDAHPTPARRSTARPHDAPPAAAAAHTPSIAPWHVMDYKKALSTTRRSEHFVKGNRNTFLYVLGNRCFRKNIPLETAIALALRDFRDDDLDVAGAIGNAYTYVSKTLAAEEAKEKNTPLVCRVLDFMASRYCFRRNVILDRLDFCGIAPDGVPNPWHVIRGKDVNSIYLALQVSNLRCPLNMVKAIVDSDYAPPFNPFEDYLLNLPRWDGVTDHIGALARTIRTEDPAFWEESFRRWLVASVACVLNDDVVNQQVLILFGGQGKGKSTWIRNLVPPVWKEYYYTGVLNPDAKDDMLLLTNRYLINMEEFQGVKAAELAALKRIVTQESVTQRKVYDLQAFRFVRRASFIASTNQRQCLQDIAGNRRFLPSSVLDVDYRTPVDHDAVYSQALSLIENGFQYWYEGDEIDALNEHNELHRMKDPVEENLFVFFRRAQPDDLTRKWMPASAVLTKISMYGRVMVTRQSQQELVQALEKYGFNTRINAQGCTEYEVVEYQIAEVEKRFGTGS